MFNKKIKKKMQPFNLFHAGPEIGTPWFMSQCLVPMV